MQIPPPLGRLALKNTHKSAEKRFINILLSEEEEGVFAQLEEKQNIYERGKNSPSPHICSTYCTPPNINW